MVDVKTLHIGSHVRLKEPYVIPYVIPYADGCKAITKIIRVSTLTERKIVFYPLTRNCEKKLRYVLAEEVDPIPITEELLKEMGFAKVFGSEIVMPTYFKLMLCGKYPIEVTYWGDETNSKGKEWVVHVDNPDCSSIGGVEVQYLHELESFVYLCTGEELIKE